MTTGTSAIVQVRPNELADVLTADFQRRAEPQFAWKSAVSSFMAIPGLRGLWPMSAVYYTSTGQARDVSGNSLSLTNNNTATFGYTNLFPWVYFVGAASQYLSRADAGASDAMDITGAETFISSALRGLTLGCWVYFDDAAAAAEVIIAKWQTSAGLRAYRLQRDAAGTLSFSVSVDGTAETTVTSTGTTIGAQTWTFVAGRFDPSTELKCWINWDTFTNTTSIPASIVDNGTDFTIGADGGPGNYMSGRVSLPFVSAMLVSDSIIAQAFEQSRVCYGILS